VVTGAGIMADPDDWGLFGAEVVKAATDERERERLRAEGARVAARYTWERAARALHGHLARFER
ncbi:MAG TPA: hypothetical protein VE570_08230, partial [Thermoleophilaceae bacterium]|nr:hypothetical protein [Thermoleophilaceae bacterium]